MKSKYLAFASAVCALMFVSTAARANYQFTIGWGGSYVFDTCYCEDPVNGSIGGEVTITTPTGPGTYDGFLSGGTYSISVTPDSVPTDGATASYFATFEADTGEGATYWEMAGSSGEGAYGFLNMYATDTDIPGYGGGSSGISFDAYVVPEPASGALMLAGLGLVAFAARRRA